MTTLDDRDLIHVLREHGPAPAAPQETDAALEVAATRLAERIRTAPTPARRSPRRTTWIGLSAAALAAGLVVAPGLAPGGHDVALARTDPLVFAASPGWLPPGLDDQAVFLRDGDLSLARYGSTASGVSIVLTEDGYDAWEPAGPVTEVDVDGREGQGFSTGDASWTVVWEDGAGDELGVTGRGSYADPDLVRRVAESLSATPQRVGLALTVAPSDWQVTSFVSDHHLTMSGPDGDQLTLSVLDGPGGGLADEPGTSGLEEVDLSGRPAQLARRQADNGTGEIWLLEARDPAGTAFTLQAPASLSRDQVLVVARGVRATG